MLKYLSRFNIHSMKKQHNEAMWLLTHNIASFRIDVPLLESQRHSQFLEVHFSAWAGSHMHAYVHACVRACVRTSAKGCILQDLRGSQLCTSSVTTLNDNCLRSDFILLRGSEVSVNFGNSPGIPNAPRLLPLLRYYRALTHFILESSCNRDLWNVCCFISSY